MVRARVAEGDVEDVVQATLADALAAEKAPDPAEEFRKWVFGIARHKIADLHRKAARVELTGDPPEAEATSAPHAAQDLAHWAERELPGGTEAKKTLAWMAREADGEKLESIAAEERLPAARVRQRVWRLRRFFRERWAAAVAVVAILVATGIAFWRTLSREAPPPVASSAPGPTPLDEARKLRDAALERCGASAWDECVRGLDHARALDPVGDEAEAVQEARAVAARARLPEMPSPTPSATEAPVPSASAAPSPPRAVPTSAPRPPTAPRSSIGSVESEPSK